MKHPVGSSQRDGRVTLGARAHAGYDLDTICSTPDRLISEVTAIMSRSAQPHKWAIKKHTACPLPHPCISNCANRLLHPSHLIRMSMVMAKVPSSPLRVTEPGQGDPQHFQIESNEHRRVISIKSTQESPLPNLSDTGILEHAPLKRNIWPERDEAESTLSKLVSLGKRKEPSPPLDDLLGDSSESSRADSPLPPRKVARISHAIKKVAGPTKLSHEVPLETNPSGVYPCPCSKLCVT